MAVNPERRREVNRRSQHRHRLHERNGKITVTIMGISFQVDEEALIKALKPHGLDRNNADVPAAVAEAFKRSIELSIDPDKQADALRHLR